MSECVCKVCGGSVAPDQMAYRSDEHGSLLWCVESLTQRLAAAEARERWCKWTIIDCSKAETSCGHVRSICAFRQDFCSYCGGRVVEVKAKGGGDA